jgi:hypothetical protein
MNKKKFNQMTAREKSEWVSSKMIDYSLNALPENEMELVANYLNVNYNGLIY